METICRVPCPEDGLVFDVDTLAVMPIRDDQVYGGQRAIMQARLGNARIRLQVDFGFGDAVSITPREETIPTLIDSLPSPVVRAYPKVATVAEKFEAMVQLGRTNSRMKDFHDIWALARAFDFDGASLREAVAACFARRGTTSAPEMPVALSAAFYSDPDVEARWRAYLRKGQFQSAPPESFSDVGDTVRAFLSPGLMDPTRHHRPGDAIGRTPDQQWHAVTSSHDTL